MGYLFVFVITALITIFWGGFVTATLWGWFMVPLGVKAITYWHAVGLGALFGVFTGSRGLQKEGEAGDIVLYGLVMAAAIPAVCLAFGWLAKINL